MHHGGSQRFVDVVGGGLELFGCMSEFSEPWISSIFIICDNEAKPILTFSVFGLALQLLVRWRALLFFKTPYCNLPLLQNMGFLSAALLNGMCPIWLWKPCQCFFGSFWVYKVETPLWNHPGHNPFNGCVLKNLTFCSNVPPWGTNYVDCSVQNQHLWYGSCISTYWCRICCKRHDMRHTWGGNSL